jgi:hypothetical protein
MNFLYGSSEFNDLLQECHLAQSSILSGIEFLVKANIYDNKDGLFYSSFFNLSIGVERFLKIALVTEYMYSNNFRKPNYKYLTSKNHNLITSFNDCADVFNKHGAEIPHLDETHQAQELFNFLSTYAEKTRYQNLNKLTNSNKTDPIHPIHAWVEISESYLRKYIKNEKINAELLKHYSKYPMATGFTYHLDFNGSPLLAIDLLMYQYIIKKSRPYIINDLIQTLKPIHQMLNKISLETNNDPNADLNGAVPFPYYGDLFPFFFADIELFKRVKNWIHRY